jgi:streptogramin lyase
MRSTMRRLGLAAASAALVGTAAATAAQAAPSASPEVFPAGTACAGFDLQVDSTGGKSRTREITDSSGTLVGTVTTGTGPAYTFTNLATGATYSTRSKGAVQKVQYHPDFSTTLTLTGTNLLILDPNDTPAGPSTTLQTGRVVVEVSADTGAYTVTARTGTSIDVCAALTG